MAVVAGVTSVSGAFVGGILLMLLPVIQATIPSLSGLVFLVIGFGAVMLGRDPNGLVNLLFKGFRLVEPRLPLPPRLRRAHRRASRPPSASEPDVIGERQVAGHGVA